MIRCRWNCGYQSTEQVDVDNHETYMLAIDDSEHQESALYGGGPIRSFKDLQGGDKTDDGPSLTAGSNG